MKIKNLIRIITLTVISGIFFYQCNMPQNAEESNEKSGLEMAKWMADSEMEHFPRASTVDFNPDGKWSYTAGLVSKAMVELSEETGDDKYYEYAKGYADEFINDSGEIKGYKMSDFNIDKINSGKYLFTLYEKTGDEKYKIAIETLRDQLRNHPRTSEGGFWHKKRYTHQMWLDGLYMGAPFYAQYAKEMNKPELFSDVVNQFVTVHKHTYDPEVGLNYHGWDESKSQQWADTETGQSPHFWGRAMGWYAMALVDVLDFIPQDHPGQDSVVSILNDVAAGIKKFQDEESGVWYQVLDMGEKEGNYLESSASSMFVYSLYKAVRKGYIDESYAEVADKGYKGILNNFIKENENGTIDLTDVCSVAGLGGNPYRDGSFEYYISEPKRANDPKGVGPFIMAGIEKHKQ